ncbi:MAG: histidine phosphatase family protein [Gaiellaceae bacterium]
MRRLVALALVTLAGCGGAETPTPADGRLDPVRLVEALQKGGSVVYLRHAATDRSKEDAGVVDLGDCSSQRNLNDAGREQAAEIGRGFRALRIPLGEVQASEYCRTRETAELAFGRFELEPDLTGFPNDGTPEFAARVRRTKELLAQRPGENENTVLVAHIKNIEASAGISIEEGELAVFEPLGGTSFRYRGRIPAAAWPQLVDELR